MLTEMEKGTFDSLNRVCDFYKNAEKDADKLYHLQSGISLLSALKTFIESKMEFQKEREAAAAKQHQEVKIEVNVGSKDGKEGG